METPPGSERKPVNRRKNVRKHKLKIERVEKISVDDDSLPDDAVFKGYMTVTVQNNKFETDKAEYQLERYYSLGEEKTYEA